jgi:hypothetical protein
MPDKPTGEHPITDEDRLAVRKLLIGMLQAENPELAEDTRIFRYQFITPTGNTGIDFEPGDGFIDWAIVASNRTITHALEEATDTLILKGTLSPETKTNPQVVRSIKSQNPHVVAAYFGYVTMMRLIEKIKVVFQELPRETETILENIILKAMKETGFTEQTGYELNIGERVDKYAREVAEHRKKTLLRDIKIFSKEPRFDYFPQIYPQALKIWQDVRKIYRANSETETWRDMVKAKYPDLEFPDDLLTRITGKPELLPEEIQARLAETDGDCTPSSVALEYTAREVGAKPYQFGTRYYQKLASQKKRTD